MNVGVDIRCLMAPNRTGVGEYTHQLLDAVFKIDKINQYFLFYNSSKDVSQYIPKWNQENVRFVATKWPNKLLNLLLFLRVLKLENLVIKKLFENCKLKIENLDCWFFPNLNFTSLSRKTKFFLTIHDLSFEFLPECLTFKQRLWHMFLRPKKQCQRADMILVPSENTAGDIVSKYGVDKTKIKVIKHGHKLQITNYKLQIKDKYILYLGTLEPRKNVETIILAFKRLLSTFNYPLSFIIAGDRGWKSDKLMRLINSTHGVEYVGYVDEAKKAELYHNASLFVFPSLYEGFGLPILEAMSAGVPVITSNRSSLLEVGGDAVYYVNPNNVAELAEAMKLVLIDEKLRQTMIQKGLERANMFGWMKSAEEFVQILT